VVVCTLAAAGLALGACGPSAVQTGATRGTVAYVATLAGRADPGDTLSVFDTATSTALPDITTGTLPSAMASTPDGTRLLVADKGSDQLTEVDTADGSVVARVTVGVEPDAVAVTPDGTTALVANFIDGTVTPVALPSMHAGRPVPVGKQPVAIAITPDGSTALVADFGDGTVTPLALPSLTPGTPIDAGTGPVAVAIAPDGTPIRLAHLTTLPSIPLAGNPTDIALSPTGATAYLSGGDSVLPVNLTTLQAGAPIPVGAPAEALAVTANGLTAWVCTATGRVVPVNLVNGSLAGSVEVGGQPTAIVIPMDVGAGP
jgi:YVTN family beta-propeller protein